MPGTKPPTLGPTITLWPADAGALPFVRRWDLRPADGGLEWMGSGELVDLPDDFVLREVLEAETSEDGVLAFVQAWGPLTPPGDHALDLLPPDPRERGSLRTHDRSGWVLATELHHLHCLRALSRFWLASVTDDDVRDAWTAEGFNTPHSASLALGWWVDYMNAGLSRFQMHIVVDDEGWERRGYLAREPCLYEVAVRQLAMLATDGVAVQHCANITCRRPFTRQRTARRGRNGYGPRERGVKYCSNLCAKAQAERERRARRKAES